MRRATTVLCFLALLPLLLVSGRLSRALPVDRAKLAAEKYAGYSGVLRIWLFEGWAARDGSLLPWLNARAAAFERRNEGVYVQITSVTADALRGFASSGINPPDALLFPPGLLSDGAGLIPLSTDAPLRPGLPRAGFALPVAMGLYGWAFDRQAADGAPSDWAASGLAPACPPDEPWRCLGGALAGLCAGLRPDGGAGEGRGAGPGLDLGLPEGAPTPAPEPTARAGVSAALPDGMAQREGALDSFISGEVDACVVGLAEIGRLERLSAAGKGPDWAVSAPGGVAVTDQVLYFAVADSQKRMGEEREALCAELGAWLLRDESQAALANRGALSVTVRGRLYAAGAMAQLEAAAAEATLIVPNAFSGSWRAKATDIVRIFLEKGVTADAAAAHLAEIMKNPNENANDNP